MLRRSCLALCLWLLPLLSYAQETAPPPAATEPVAAEPAKEAPKLPTREHLAPAGWEASYHQIHYTPVVKVGDLVIVSGIPAAIGDSEEEKIRWAFEQMRLHLEKAGASMADVVELTSYHVSQNHDEFRTHFNRVLKIHEEFFKSHYPAWTAVGTTGLYTPGVFMEISARAVIGSGKNPKADIPKPKDKKKD